MKLTSDARIASLLLASQFIPAYNTHSDGYWQIHNVCTQES